MEVSSLTGAVLRCWPIGPSCQIDWEAWATVATTLGVLIALLTPIVNRLRTQRRANALFALHYMTNVSLIEAKLAALARQFPLGAKTTEAEKIERRMIDEPEFRATLRDAVAELDERSRMELDISKWPAVVNLRLVAHVSLALSSANDVALTAIKISHGVETDDLWPECFRLLHGLIATGKRAASAAEVEIKSAARGLRIRI